MSSISCIVFLATAFFIITSVLSSPVPEAVSDKSKAESAAAAEEGPDENELGTVSPTEMEKLKEEIIENQEENADKFNIPLTSSPEEIETFLKKEEEELGPELPEKIEGELAESDDDFKNFVHFLALFDKIETEASDKEEEEVEKSPAEMKEMKAQVFELTNELNKRQGLPEVSHEEFDKVWNKKKEEYGKKFPGKVEKLIKLLKEVEETKESTTLNEEVSETSTEGSTRINETSKELPQGAFALTNAKGKICILAKFHSSITITYPGKSSEQKVEVTIPPSGLTKGKCGGPNRLPTLQISWGKFVFSLFFNKTIEDSWLVTLVELTYDTSEPLFDGAAKREKFVAKSQKVSLFETPLGKSYFCPAQEVILLYNESKQHVATVRLKEVHLQPFDVEDGKFSASHRCNQVVIGGPDEEPFVQDETVPLAVGCTLALITLMILVGFAVHRAYNAAKVDYNTVE